MSATKPARTEREILNELRAMSKKMVGQFDGAMLQHADAVLWEAYERGLFGRDKNVEYAAQSQRSSHEQARRNSSESFPHISFGFSVGLLFHWYSIIVMRPAPEFLASESECKWPKGYSEMLQAIPSLIGVSDTVRKRAKILIEENARPPYRTWVALHKRWGGDYSGFRKRIVPQLQRLGYDLTFEGIRRVE